MENQNRREMAKGNNIPSQNLSGDEFHEALNKEIIGEEEFEPITTATFEEPEEKDPSQKHPDNNGELAKRLETLEQRYESSSNEGKRLAEENKRLAEENARLQAGETQKPPKNLKEALGLEEDFVYDGQEAIDNPESDSGRYRRAEIALEAKRIVDAEKQNDMEEFKRKERDNQKNVLMQKYGLDEAGWQEFEENVKGKQWTLEDLYILQHPEIVANTAMREMTDEQFRHLQKIGNFGKTLAHSGGGTKQTGLSGNEIFDSMFGIDNSKFVTKDEI